MTRETWPIHCAIAGFATAALIYVSLVIVGQWRHAALEPVASPAVAFARAPATAAAAVAEPAAGAPVAMSERSYYDALRTRVRWMPTRLGNAPDYDTRLLLAKSAAQRAGLAEVGLGYRDVYGLITAETSWVPRRGAGRRGTPSYGVAQFEPATARALGVRDPNDLVEAVHVAAVHMKEAAMWSSERVARLRLGADERADKLREGISVYYNLSSKGRAQWNGLNASRLPVETQRHIFNARMGAQEAAWLDAQSRAGRFGGDDGTARAVLTASR
ncbi:hypothetical protein [Caenimonas aquaedulcis]|uniref:Transglycosylase SLT domain-containing protein n=1 Tax=Caenimonas aquaedulcis TaxID=2793270 RepID=A0A931MEV9_9BURK|nr:hypothetical protein [Caenimonas aquaedulcis]MBG9386674.1 hypothetical protein [Caenimonas aquaedulcis]